jgi:hypothetical protein
MISRRGGPRRKTSSGVRLLANGSGSRVAMEPGCTVTARSRRPNSTNRATTGNGAQWECARSRQIGRSPPSDGVGAPPSQPESARGGRSGRAGAFSGARNAPISRGSDSRTLPFPPETALTLRRRHQTPLQALRRGDPSWERRHWGPGDDRAAASLRGAASRARATRHDSRSRAPRPLAPRVRRSRCVSCVWCRRRRVRAYHGAMSAGRRSQVGTHRAPFIPDRPC